MRILYFTLLTIFYLSFAQDVTAQQASNPRAFFKRFARIAQYEMTTTGIPASIKLGQAAFESNWAKSNLATEANNYFGIKCRKGNCPNPFLKKDDDRNANGILIHSKFMRYKSAKASFVAHSHFLQSNNRYNELFSLAADDYIGWAKGLQAAGYATDPLYAKKLITLIEKYELHKYDQQVILQKRRMVMSNTALNKLEAMSNPTPKPVKATTAPQQFEAPANPVGSTIGHVMSSAPENPLQKMTSSTSGETIESGLHKSSFGSQDISEYVPKFQRELFKENTKGKKEEIKRLKKYPSKRMIRGGTAPR